MTVQPESVPRTEAELKRLHYGASPNPHISWFFAESESLEAAKQAMCGLNGKPRPLKSTSQTAQVVDRLVDRKRFLSTGSKRFHSAP
jgi:hypothetical protein